jgi:outer membrane protein assembly factor BamB
MPFPDEWIENIVTPLVYKKMIILSGVRRGTLAIRVIKSGNNWTTEQVWENKEVPMYMSTPVLVGDRLFGFSSRNSGQFFCLEASSGAILWKSEGRQGKNASLLKAGDLLFLLTDEGKLIVAKNNPNIFEPVTQYAVGEGQTWSHPIILESKILIKDNSSLSMWSFE